MVNTLYLPELREMLAEDNAAEMREFCLALHPARTAEFMEGLTAAEAWAILRHGELNTRAEVFGYFDREKQVEIIEAADRPEIAELIVALPPDDRVDILKEVQPEVVEALLPLIPTSARRDILRLRAYPEGTAGAIMTTGFARIIEGLTVRQAWEEIGRQAEKLETIYYVYVLDDDDHLRGVISARQLVASIKTPAKIVDDMMERAAVTVFALDDQESVAQKVAKFDLHAIPVVDTEHHMLGIVTHDDVIDVVREEATEDVYRMGAVGPLEENYLEASFATIWRKRAVWLSCLFVAELLTFTALSSYEEAIKQFVVLSLFLPLCISTGGNSGSQAATLITRAMALGQVTIRDWWRVFRHELLMGLALACTLGAIGFVRAYLTPTSKLDGADPISLALVISQSITLICIWGTLVGAMLPLVFKWLGFDPGYASSPFVATFVDVTGILIYFTSAHMYFKFG